MPRRAPVLLLPFLGLTAVTASPLLSSRGDPCEKPFCLVDEDPCPRDQMEWDSGCRGHADRVWSDAGVENYLTALLDKGVEDWSNAFFEENGIGGTAGGTVYDCTDLYGGTCTTTAQIEDYLEPSAFYLHAAMVNLYKTYSSMHEDLQDLTIFGLAKGVKDIKEVFGPPKPSQDMTALMIGLFVFAAGLAGPHWKVGSPLTGMVGGMNMASSVSKDEDQELEDDLESFLGSVFHTYSLSLKTASSTFFKGNFSAAPFDVGDPQVFIFDSFAKGKLLDKSLVADAKEAWKNSLTDAVTAALIFMALKHQEYYVQIMTDVKEKECNDWKKAAWVENKCVRVVKLHAKNGGHLGLIPDTHENKEIEDKLFDSMTKTYKIEYSEAMANAVKCNGGEPEIPAWPGLDRPNRWPSCFVNLKLKECEYHKVDRALNSCA